MPGNSCATIRQQLHHAIGAEAKLAPIHVILRTQTHLFHHMGQIAAMCRLPGHPVPEGMDFPVR